MAGRGGVNGSGMVYGVRGSVMVHRCSGWRGVGGVCGVVVAVGGMVAVGTVVAVMVAGAVTGNKADAK